MGRTCSNARAVLLVKKNIYIWWIISFGRKIYAAHNFDLVSAHKKMGRDSYESITQ
jgi:hypothetical protein